MAADADVVRITYREIEEIASISEEKENEELNKKPKEETKKKKDDDKKKKRPAVGIYQPPSLLRHKQEVVTKEKEGEKGTAEPETAGKSISSEENWDNETTTSTEPSSKETSVEKELINSGLDDAQSSSDRRSKGRKSEEGRRKKRPEIQRYVPRGKIQDKQAAETSGDGSGDWDDELSSPSPKIGHSPSPGPAQTALPLVPSPRRIDLKNMQVTVVNDKAGKGEETPPKPETGSKNQGGNARGVKGHTQGQTYSRGRGHRYNQRSNQGQGHRSKGQTDGENKHIQDTAKLVEEKCSIKEQKETKPSQEVYIVPSRPNTIGQEADRTDTIGSDDSKSQFSEIKPGLDRQALMMKLNKIQKNKKSRSFDKLDKQENWEEEGYYPDTKNLGTMIFERSRSSDQLNLSGKPSVKPPIPRSASGGMKPVPKKMAAGGGGGGMRKRTDSFSSDVSTGTGSDWSTEDLDWDKDVEPGHIDWTEEVDRELALQVQDETQKMNAWFEKQELGLSQEPGLSQDDLLSNRSNNARNDIMTSSTQGFYRDFPSSKTDYSSEKSNTLPFAHRRKNNERQGRTDRRRGSLGFRSRDSSVSSAHSVQSVQSVQSAYSGSEGRRRRRRRRKSSTSSQKMGGGSMERKNMSIQVTCGGGREVKVGGQGQGRPSLSRQNSSEGYYDNRGRGESWAGKQNANRGNKVGRDDRNYNQGQYKGDRGRGHGGRERASSEPHYDDRNKWSRDDRGGHQRHGRGRQRTESGGKGGHTNWNDQNKHYKDEGRYGDNRQDYNYNDRSRSGQQERQQQQQQHRDRGQHEDRGHREGGRWEGRGDRYNKQRNYKKDEARPVMGTERHKENDTHHGGLIHLPPKSRTPDPGGQRDNHWDRGPGGQDWGKGQQRERNRSGSQQKTLFDPDNPSKPIVIEEAQPKLDFKDTDSHPSSPQSPQMMGAVPPGYGRGYPGFYPPPPGPQGYGYGYNMPPMPPHPMMGPPRGMFYGYPPQFREGQMPYPGENMPREPYYQDEGEGELGYPGNRGNHNKLMAEQLLRETLPMDKQLNNLIARRINGQDTLHLINQLRRELLVRYEQLILLDADLCNKHNVEQALWKSVFYQMVELTRRQLAEDHAEETKLQLNKILEEGTSFYENLLEKLQSTFRFKLSGFLDPNILPPENLGRTIKLALLSAQRTMICLGDIARYKEQHNSSGKVNYAKARSWYTKAQQMAPKNGRPYNQLAILALYTKRKLDAVYYYMRSLAASNPFLTARESLMSLFDEARKKAEVVEKKREEERKKHQSLRKNQGTSQDRVEIWIKNDGTSVESKVDDSYDDDLSKLETVELNKRFILSFLNIHGKLFTKIGMEMFVDSCAQMLHEFQVLLRDNAIGPTRLLQLMAINMFAVENTALKDESLEAGYKSLLQQYSVQMGLDMFGILLEKCARLLQEHVHSDDYPARMFSRELEELIPGVKVWTDWMICHNDLWNPPPSVRDPTLGPQIDVWSAAATMCNILQQVNTSHIEFFNDRKEGLDPVILTEDTMMSGFVPLLSTPLNNTFVSSATDKEMARDCLRVEKLRVFGEYLCGIDVPMLAYSGESHKYYSVAPPEGYETDNKEPETEQLSDEDEIVIESEEEIIHEEAGLDDDHVHQLKAKKEELQKKMAEKKRLQETRKNMLERNRHSCIEIRIRPIFLIPDTNCFIDHLPSLQKLITDRQYTIVIPLVVINELDGLAQGKRVQQCDSSSHMHKVKSRAADTIAYLEQEFDKKNTHLKALTSKGTAMETISFRSEETDLTGNNDDLILSCCTHYCQDKASVFMPKNEDTPVHLYREVVLLTDDRNLRLKAHTHNVPVKDIPSFMKWSSGT